MDYLIHFQLYLRDDGNPQTLTIQHSQLTFHQILQTFTFWLMKICGENQEVRILQCEEIVKRGFFECRPEARWYILIVEAYWIRKHFINWLNSLYSDLSFVTLFRMRGRKIIILELLSHSFLLLSLSHL